MQDKALIVVDMVNGFINEGPLSDSGIRRIIHANMQLIESFIAAKQPVVAFRDAHQEDAQEFGFYPVHCVEGSPEAELIDELVPYAENMLVIAKNTTNGFFTQLFQTFMKDHPQLRDIYVSGCCTDICVLQFALSLKTYAQTIDWKLDVHVLEDAVDTFDAPWHNRDAMQAVSLGLLKAAGIHIEDSKNLI